MTMLKTPEVNAANQWRTVSKKPEGWAKSPRPGAEQKYFICSVDSHITPPRNLVRDQIDGKYRDRLPRLEMKDGEQWMIIDGEKPFRLVSTDLVGEDRYRAKAGCVEDMDADIAIRLADMDADGIDSEVVFPNGPIATAFFTTDMEFAMAQFQVYNDWATEVNSRYGDRIKIAPCIPIGDVDAAIVEVQRVVAMGSNVVSLPTQPVPGIVNSERRLNDKTLEPLWAVIAETGARMAFHVATGGDPRKARGKGGTIMNRAISHEDMILPITAFIGAGILDRYPTLRFACVEGGIGWIPALLDLMDETYLKHHMWVFPKLDHGLPSEYFREHAVASFQEDRSGLLLVEHYGLEKNICWSNDYPHHEGTWPHSAAAIERQFTHLKEETRANILGLNAARFFDFKIPPALA